MFEVEKDLIKLNEGRRNIYVTSGAFMLAVTIDKAADDGMSAGNPTMPTTSSTAWYRPTELRSN
ncbi:MAG: hypothetical protein WA418_20070 [Bradyrhizobium sp.]